MHTLKPFDVIYMVFCWFLWCLYWNENQDFEASFMTFWLIVACCPYHFGVKIVPIWWWLPPCLGALFFWMWNCTTYSCDFFPSLLRSHNLSCFCSQFCNLHEKYEHRNIVWSQNAIAGESLALEHSGSLLALAEDLFSNLCANM